MRFNPRDLDPASIALSTDTLSTSRSQSLYMSQVSSRRPILFHRIAIQPDAITPLTEAE